MKKIERLFLLPALSVIVLSCSNKKSDLTKDEIVSVVREAYLYAAPMVYTDVTRINSPAPDNRLNYITQFPDHTFKHVVAPNNDTNYSTAFLELAEEPVVVEIPDMQGRYYVFPLQDAWTNNFALPGKRTTGTGEQKYLITGPGWTGDVPDGLTQIQAPTNLVWAIGRIQVNSPEDQEAFVIPLQKKFILKPLSEWLAKDTTSPLATGKKQYGHYIPDDFRGQTVVEIIKRLPLEDYFNYFNELLADNPPFEADSALIAKIAEVGIGAGKHFSLAGFDEDTQHALNNLTDAIYKELDDAYLKQDKDKRTTEQWAKVGDYKTDYYGRALVAYKGLGALPPEEAVYYLYTEDGEREILNGSKHNYLLHFEKGQTPPAQAFWSYTVYGKDRYLVENPIRRFAIGDRSQLKYNADGSLDLYLNAESPGKDKEANWLPAPKDTFFIALRIYVPHERFLKDRAVWNDPLPEKINYFPPVNSDEWESLPSSSLQWNQSVIDSLYGYLEEANTKAFILLYDGRIVLEKYFHGHTPDKTWYWASAGKSLTAFLIGIAQQEKHLSIADPASLYLGRGWTSATPEQESKITIRHQLTMTSGLNDGHGTGFCTDDSCLTFLSGAGARWAYHNAPYTLLDRVLQKATGGHSLSDFVRLKLKDKTGINGAYHPSGYNKIFFSTARCMARYGLLVLNEGNWNGDRILTDTAFFRQMVNTSQPLNKSYGYLWWLNGKSSYMQPQSQEVFDGALVPNAPPDMIAALGMNGQIINITPSRRIVVIRMGDAPTDTKTSLSNRIWEFINRFEDTSL